MADTTDWGADGSDGVVTYLESSLFADAIQSFETGVKTYSDILNTVKQATATLLLNWKGEGKTQFEKDYNTIFKQLEDIGDILYDLREALINAETEYYQTDDEVAKLLNS